MIHSRHRYRVQLPLFFFLLMYILSFYFLYAIANPLLDQSFPSNISDRLTPMTWLLLSVSHSLPLSCPHPVEPNRTSSSTRPRRLQDHHSLLLRFCHQLYFDHTVTEGERMEGKEGKEVERGRKKDSPSIPNSIINNNNPTLPSQPNSLLEILMNLILIRIDKYEIISLFLIAHPFT